MDSHLIAGAYSQQFLALKDDETLINSDRLNSIARAQRLSHETNRRRKLQAQKRKLQAKREEKRRYDILTKRREEQRQATEKYQRSHLPPSARQSYRYVQRRPDGDALDNALQLIRGVPHYNRPMSSHERILSQIHANEDPLEVSFRKPRPHSTRPGSGRSVSHLNAKEQAELMNYSKQNLTAGKTLFEQLLEQQQRNLEQQQLSLQEFNNAVHNEIDGKESFGRAASDQFIDSDAQDNKGNIVHSDSCSSLDSLEGSNLIEQQYPKPINSEQTLAHLNQRPVSAYHGSGNGQNGNQNKMSSLQQQLELQQHQQRMKNMMVASEQRDVNHSQNITIHTKAIYQKNESLSDIPKSETKLILDASDYTNTKLQQPSYNDLTSGNDMQRNKDKFINRNDKINLEQKCQMSPKQFSMDSLESCSSGSSISVIKFQGVTKEPKNVENSSKVCTSELNNNCITGTAGNNTGSHKQQYSGNVISNQKFAVLSTNVSTQPGLGQEAWVSPSPKMDTTAIDNQNKLIDNFQPRYASAIGLSIWPGSNVQDQMAVSMASTINQPYSSSSIMTLGTTTTPSPLLARAAPNTITFPKAGTGVGTVAKADTSGNEIYTISPTSTVTNKDMTNDYSYLNIHDLTHPQMHGYHDLGNIPPSSNQRQAQSFSTMKVYNYQPQLKVPNSQVTQDDIEGVFASSKQTTVQFSTIQHSPTSESTYHLHQGQDTGVHSQVPQNLQHYQLNVPAGTMPIPAVIKSVPASRPPSPVFNTAGPQLTSKMGMVIKTTSDQASASRSLKDQAGDNYVEDGGLVEQDSEEMRPLRGILKQTTVTQHCQENNAAGKAIVRDSLELAHVQNKKSKKKSVRFASHEVEEDDSDSDETDHNDKWGVANARSSSYKNTSNQPLSAKVASMATKQDTDAIVNRALSAGSYRQQPVVSEHIQIRNVQQMSSGSAPVSSETVYEQRSNLPSSFVSPVNTSPIHRPKAAAHIIMSTDIHNEASKGYDANNTGPLTAHKSQLETKIKSINNNFMSKVPVKIPTRTESDIVYNAAFAHAEGNSNSNAKTVGNNMAPEENVHQLSRELLQQQNFDKLRNAYYGSKRVSFSSSNVTQASTIPPSTSVTYAQPSGGSASFSANASKAIYDETGMRVDRTPTDDEITWLWDKVRNCLNRESGNKSHSLGNGNNDQGPRPPPTLSTKLIDGAALGFGTHQNGATAGINSVRPGSGFFLPRATPPSNISNSAKPVVQLQGSYLRRYGLLKQRRATSASAIRNNTIPEGQRPGGVLYGRNSGIQPHQPSSVPVQIQSRDIPTPMAFGYRPQEEVSESTAAFLMAERLAKQSLSDSHIQIAMEDAQNKQEAYNRSKMTEARNGVSALSLEEYKLLESLDRLNDKLKATDPNFKGNVHYHHQPTQAQLPAFQSHRPTIETKWQTQMAPRTQHRSQSARVRPQTYQYR